MDEKQIRELVSQAVEDAIAKAGEQFAEQAQAAAQEAIAEATKAKGGDGGQAGGVSAEQVGKIVADAIAAEMSSRDEKAAKDAKNAEGKKALEMARQKYLDAHGKKIPEAYRSHIPVTDDEAQLKAGVDKAIKAMQADAEKHGWKLPDIGDTAGADSEATAKAGKEAVDKMSPGQKIAAGLAEQQ